MVTRVLVDQTDIREMRLDEVAQAPLVEGEVRLALQSFALTANNVTYAATGFVIGYWRFFPTGIEGQGIVPVWGVARVVESRSEAVPLGAEYYGFYPMAEELVIRPEQTSRRVVVDRLAHRADLPLVYNSYVALPEGRSARQDHLQALLQPLIATSYLLFDWLMDNGCFGAEQIVIGSASSKTGLGLCMFLAEPEGRPYRIAGLTSERNRAFVDSLKACDQVLSYDQVETLAKVPSVYVDMAGDSAVKLRLHTHLGDNVLQSAAVGTSHWDKFEKPQPMPGAKPKFFFAPAQIAKRREEWGAGVIERQIEEATQRIAAQSADWLTVMEHEGLASLPAVYDDLAKGKASPNEGHVFTL